MIVTKRFYYATPLAWLAFVGPAIRQTTTRSTSSDNVTTCDTIAPRAPLEYPRQWDGRSALRLN